MLGKSAELRHAAALARLDLDAAGKAADALMSVAILRDGRPLEFIHPIVRTTVYAEIPTAQRAASHGRAVLLLERDGVSAAELAPHVMATEPSGDPSPNFHLATWTLVYADRLERADMGECRAFLAEHGVDEDMAAMTMASRLLYSRGHMRLTDGDPEGALRDFEQIRDRERHSGFETAAIATRGSAALAHAQLGEDERARELATEELRRARVWGTPSALSFALRSAGLVTGGGEGLIKLDITSREQLASALGPRVG